MKSLIRPAALAITVPMLGVLAPAAAQGESAAEPQCFFESRSGVNVECGIYHSEIGNSDAYVQTVVNRHKWPLLILGKHGKRRPQPIILDVRSTPEYKAGHPEHAYNVPYPYIYQECVDVDDEGKPNPDGSTKNDRTPDGACVKAKGKDYQIDQNPQDFVSYVERIAPDKDTPIFTMCRTGVRSVGAANRLTEAGYTNVRNMWEGFVGIFLKAPQVIGTDENGKPIIGDGEVDLNHDGQFTDEDKNGWRYHQGLPYEARLWPHLIYWPYAYTYRLD